MLLDDLILRYITTKDQSNFGTKDKIFLFREFAYLIEWGVSVVDATETIGQTTDNFAVKSICTSILQSLNAGESFSRSLMRIGRYFNEWDVNIIKSGESWGELVKVLKYLAKEYEFIHDIQGKYTGAMMYPAVLFTVSIAAVAYLFVSVLPSIFDIVKDFDNVQVPYFTQLMMHFTQFLGDYRAMIGIGLLVVVVIISLILSTDSGKKTGFELLIGLPVLGKLVRYYHMVKFFRYLKLMLMSGMNYVDACMFLRGIVTAPPYQEMIEKMIIWLRKGETLYTNMKYYTHIIPADVMVLVKVGEDTANLPNTIENIISIYAEDLNKMLDNLSKIIEPILIVFVGFIIMMIAASVFGVIGSILDAAQLWAG